MDHLDNRRKQVDDWQNVLVLAVLVEAGYQVHARNVNSGRKGRSRVHEAHADKGSRYSHLLWLLRGHASGDGRGLAPKPGLPQNPQDTRRQGYDVGDRNNTETNRQNNTFVQVQKFRSVLPELRDPACRHIPVVGGAVGVVNVGWQKERQANHRGCQVDKAESKTHAQFGDDAGRVQRKSDDDVALGDDEADEEGRDPSRRKRNVLQSHGAAEAPGRGQPFVQRVNKVGDLWDGMGRDVNKVSKGQAAQNQVGGVPQPLSE